VERQFTPPDQGGESENNFGACSTVPRETLFELSPLRLSFSLLHRHPEVHAKWGSISSQTDAHLKRDGDAVVGLPAFEAFRRRED
jgi:hypothetical protein